MGEAQNAPRLRFSRKLVTVRYPECTCCDHWDPFGDEEVERGPVRIGFAYQFVRTRTCGLRLDAEPHVEAVKRVRRAWRGVLGRCCRSNATGFAYYGGKGISVADEWRADFDAFLADVGVPPVAMARPTLDRIDPAGNYEPGNVRWLDRGENSARASTPERRAAAAARRGVKPARAVPSRYAVSKPPVYSEWCELGHVLCGPEGGVGVAERRGR